MNEHSSTIDLDKHQVIWDTNDDPEEIVEVCHLIYSRMKINKSY